MEVILKQMCECAYRGSLKRLYLESKSLELLVLGLKQMYGTVEQGAGSLKLRREEKEHLLEARAIVEQQYQEPPGLTELSRRVGLNTTKLKRGFRELYGASVFEYVRYMRLSQGRALLDQGEMDVTRICYTVGYRSLSHFSKAFKETFGISPSFYLRTTKRRSLIDLSSGSL